MGNEDLGEDLKEQLTFLRGAENPQKGKSKRYIHILHIRIATWSFKGKAFPWATSPSCKLNHKSGGGAVDS